MASREERQGRWDPEAPGASGGHIAPDVAATGPLFDPVTGSVEAPTRPPDPAPWLDDPVHSPTDASPARGDVLPGSSPLDRSRPSGPPRRRLTTRRVKRTIHHVTPFSVLKLSLFFYAAFLVMWLIFVAFVYWILSGVGFFEAFERFRRTAVLWEDLDLSLWVFERWALVIGLAMAVLGSLFNTFLAFLYNFGADTVGGVELTFVERDAGS